MDARTEEQAALFARALGTVEAALDWEALGRLYCHEGGDDFFAPEALEAARDAGLALAADVGSALDGLGLAGPGAGRSLYVGAAVAELVPMLFEALVLGREVRAASLESPERSALNRALERAEEELGQELPRIEATSGAAPLEGIRGPFGHVWMTSVLTDPEAFPALHDRLYGRGEPDAAAEREERRRARGLLEALLARMARPALLTTTDEELTLWRPLCAERGERLLVPDRARLSAVVGDPIRIAVLLAPPAASDDPLRPRPPKSAP